MKICPKCNSENPDTKSVCEICYASLTGVSSDDTDGNTEKFFEKMDRKEKTIDFINKALIPLYYLICVPLAVMCYLKIRTAFVLFLIVLLLPILYYFSVFKPEALFYLQHMFDIDNLDEVEISDRYYTSSRWSGYVILVFGILAMIKISATILT